MSIAPGIDDLELGKAAEFLVVADLILAGYRAYLTDQGLPYDVVIDDDGSLYRIQVKATRSVKAIPQRVVQTPGYLFQVRRAGKGGRRVLARQQRASRTGRGFDGTIPTLNEVAAQRARNRPAPLRMPPQADLLGQPKQATLDARMDEWEQERAEAARATPE